MLNTCKQEHSTKHHKSSTLSVSTHYNTQYQHCNGCCSKTRSEFDHLEDEDLVFDMEDEELGLAWLGVKSNDSVCKCTAGSPEK